MPVQSTKHPGSPPVSHSVVRIFFPSPHIGLHNDLPEISVEHSQSLSTTQFEAHPSPAAVFPSSHPSVKLTKIESPQIVLHVEAGVPGAQLQPSRGPVQVESQPIKGLVESSQISGGIKSPSLHIGVHTEGAGSVHVHPDSIMQLGPHPSPAARFAPP